MRVEGADLRVGDQIRFMGTVVHVDPQSFWVRHFDSHNVSTFKLVEQETWSIDRPNYVTDLVRVVMG